MQEEPENPEENISEKRSLTDIIKDWSVPIAWGVTGTCLVGLIAGMNIMHGKQGITHLQE